MSPTLLARDLLQHLFKAELELATVGQAGQGVMGGLPGKIGDVLAFLGHVVQHQDRTADLAGAADRRAHQGDRDRAAVQALDQLGMLAAAAELALDDVLNQGESVGLGVFIQKLEQRRQRQALGLLRAPVGQGFSGRVHIGNGPVDIGGNHPVANRLQCNLRPLLLRLQRIGKGMTLGQQLVGAQQRQHDQAQGRRQVGDQQQAQDHPRTFAQGIAERLGGGRHPFIDGRDARLPAMDIVTADVAGGNGAVHLLGQLIQLQQIAVAHRPQLNGFFQVAEMAEVEVQPDQAGNVVRMVAALEDTQARGLHVWIGTVQGNAQFMPTLGHGNGLLVFEVGGVVAVIGVEGQVVDGILLALGPQAFARHIAPHCRKHVETDAA